MILTTHCFIYRHALTTKTLVEELATVMQLAIILVKFLKNKALLKSYALFWVRIMICYFSTQKFTSFHAEMIIYAKKDEGIFK